MTSVDSQPRLISETGDATGIAASKELLQSLVSDLTHICRLRRDYLQWQLKAEQKLKAIVARLLGKHIREVDIGDVDNYYDSGSVIERRHLEPMMDARFDALNMRETYQKELVTLAKQLPVYSSFWEPVNGLGALGLALIVGEAGAALYPNYASPAKLWRRFGLHVLDGRSFATWKSKGGLTAAAWESAGYCPRRRSVIFQITDSLLKKQNVYKTLCDERKVEERRLAEAAGLIVAASADIPKGENAKYRSLGHIKARAERYVGKRLLRDLWRAWRDHFIAGYQSTNISPRPAIASMEKAA